MNIALVVLHKVDDRVVSGIIRKYNIVDVYCRHVFDPGECQHEVRVFRIENRMAAEEKAIGLKHYVDKLCTHKGNASDGVLVKRWLMLSGLRRELSDFQDFSLMIEEKKHCKVYVLSYFLSERLLRDAVGGRKCGVVKVLQSGPSLLLMVRRLLYSFLKR